jgi:hypothetical protein
LHLRLPSALVEQKLAKGQAVSKARGKRASLAVGSVMCDAKMPIMQRQFQFTKPPLVLVLMLPGVKVGVGVGGCGWCIVVNYALCIVPH